MNDKFTELTKELNSNLVQTTKDFILKNFPEGSDEETDLNYFINLILSSHISSAYNNLLELIRIFEAPREPIDNLISRILLAVEDSCIDKYDGAKH